MNHFNPNYVLILLKLLNMFIFLVHIINIHRHNHHITENPLCADGIQYHHRILKVIHIK